MNGAACLACECRRKNEGGQKSPRTFWGGRCFEALVSQILRQGERGQRTYVCLSMTDKI